MWQERPIPLGWLDQIRWGGRRGRKRRKEEGGERSFNFSLEFLAIGLSVFVSARGKVGPRNESYAWVPKSVG